MSQQINLFNPVFLKQKKIFTARPMAEALGAIVVGTLLMTWYASHHVDVLAQRAATSKLQLADRERRLQQASAQFAPRQHSATLAADLAQAEVELASLQRVAQFLQQGTLGNSAGYAEYFRALARQNVTGLWLTGVTIAGAEIGIQGRALQPALIPQYIGRLKSEHVMQGKTFASLDIARPDAALESAAGTVALGAAAAPYVQFSLQTTGVPAK
ncbi:hypothetical protein ASF61_06045 [Duganella sp. Leaf126]|uniref:PilN domain-containing protein n=1 Tax=Duganella sp. Leaf126 TaxID=1736266 RepID=UPI0006F91DA1|nr:PilN domain-containing protein [Duganella sp. Leaf126]KQQ40329.1 hypothetical protein ASF61_06045 [Duganella sp. Leaf126]